MSVRQDFIEAYAARWGCEEKYASGLLDHVLEEHAHELAEKIRAMNEGCGRTECVSCAHRSDAADLIDPAINGD